MTNAVAYARVSTSAQKDEVSLTTQIDAINEYAAHGDYTIIETMQEVFSGADLFERPLLSECRAGIRGGRFNALIVFDVDRLSRNYAHLAILLDECKRYNAKLLFVQTEFSDSIEGKIVFAMQGIFAESERLKIIERTVRGRNAKARNGTLSFKRKLFGYELDGEGKRVPHATESKLVVQMFCDLICGKSLRQIAAELTDKNISTPAGKPVWYANSVKVIINNPAFMGKTIVGRQKKVPKYENGKKIITTTNTNKKDHIEIPADITPPIISEKTFLRAQQILQKNKMSKRAEPKREFILRGFINCAVCGRKMSPQTAYKYRSYVCTSKQNPHTNCGVKMIGAGYVETLVWEAFVKLLKQPARLRKHIEKAAKSLPVSHLQEDLKAVRRTASRLKNEIATLVERGASVPPEVWDIIREKLEIKNREMTKLKVTEAELEGLIGAFGAAKIDTANILDVIAQIRPKLDKLNFEEKTALLKDFSVSCIWDGEEIEVNIEEKQYENKGDIDGFQRRNYRR